MKDRFPRRCDATGVGMHAGFVVYDGEHHFSEEKYLIEFLRKAYNAYESKDSDASLLEEAFANEDYYYTEWDIDDCDSWYERGDYGRLLLYTAQESAMRDIYVLYDQEKDRVYQREDGIIVYYLNFSSAFYWEGELNNSEGAKYKYEAIEAVYLPEHQSKRLYNQIKKKS
jgi:hypothetical protein